MSDDLSDFFKLVSEEKKKKKEEFNELVGDLGLDSFFSEINAEKKKIREEKEKTAAKRIEEEKKKKEELDELIGGSIDDLFKDLAQVKKNVVEDKKKEEERQKQFLNSFENFLTQKIDDIEEIKEEIVVEEQIVEEQIVEEVEEQIVEEVEEQIVEEDESLMEKSLELLPESTEVVNIDQNFATLDDLQKHYKDFLVKIQQQLSTIGGGGIEDAPKTGGPYVRQGQKWVVSSGSGGTGIGSTSILYDGSTVRVEATDYGTLTTGISSATNVSIANTFTYPPHITGGMVPKAIKSQGGYGRSSAFDEYQTGTEASQDPSDYIEYTQELANSGTWKRFGITTAGNAARDGQWWGETNPNYDQSKGLFGGLTNPAGVDNFFDFSENTSFNNAVTTGSLKYTQALGSFSLKECQVGDLVLARFDLNIMPMVTNTTVEVALIYSNRDANDNVTYTFPLTITPFTYGNGTVGRGYLLRPTITAYMANDQDVNSRSLLAIKADNPILVNPIGVLFTIQR